jgi:predicted RNA polymerase sigma factor
VSVVDVREAITHAHHQEWARVVASLTRRFGDLDIAEEAAAEAFAAAVQRWPADGVPPKPRRLADDHRQPQGHRPDPAREQARRQAEGGPALALYDQLVRIDPSPIVALNRAIAVAELDGPEVALAAVDRLEDKLAGYHAYHLTRADLLRRLGRSQKSRAAYDKAIELAGNTAETAYLIRRRDQPG